MRPLLLDLFCGAGGAAMGYHRAGFDVVGVDLEWQPHYPFPLILGDALNPLTWRPSFDCRTPKSKIAAVHASPPCQPYSTMSHRWGSQSMPLITETRHALIGYGVPYVMENVAGDLRTMKSPLELTGEMFGLRVHRPRLFESNIILLAPARPPRQRDPVAVYGRDDQRRLWTRRDGSELRAATLEQAQDAMGMDWADWDGTKEAIPPAYTECIGRQLLDYLEARATPSESPRSTAGEG